MVILQRISGPAMPTGMGCFLPQKPLEDQVMLLETMSTVLSISKAMPDTVVSSNALPSFQCLIS